MKSKLLFFFLLSLISCAPDHAYKICFENNKCINSEVADTMDKRTQGLMNYEKLDSNQGMLFVFENSNKHNFWMKNMSFPIDIIWLNKNKKIVHIEENISPCKKDSCQVYSADKESLYVIEVKANFTQENNIKTEQRVKFN
jgi:uncharacterized membrane protein (UPF0127 family)